jgi:signal transduction histidine kinase
MNGTLTARPMRLLLAASLVAAVFAAVVGAIGSLVASLAVTLVLPFGAAALSVAGLAIAMPRIDRITQHGSPATGADTGSTDAAAGVPLGSLEQALHDLARILAEGTRAEYATVWLANADKLVSAATYPTAVGAEARTTTLAALLAQPDVDHAVPVLDGSVLRAALTVGKPGCPVTPADQRLMQDVAQGAGLLLRGAQLASELEDRVRRADELAGQLQASRQRLAKARDVERHRLVGELTQVTTARLANLRGDIGTLQDLLSSDEPDIERTQQTVAQARTGLDELLDRFRVIARGVYPAVLRHQGPASALEEVASDLPRSVRLSGRLSRRWSWEIESGIYWLAASAMQQLAGRCAEAPLRVRLEHVEHRLVVRIEDPTLAMPVHLLHAALTDDVDRLAALGGNVEIAEDGAGGLALRAWLPDQLEPPVDNPTRRPTLPIPP